MKIKELIAINLKRIRKERGLSRKELAELCGVGISAIKTGELGSFVLSEPNREKICAGLEIDESDLVAPEPTEAPDYRNVSQINENSIAVDRLLELVSKRISFIPSDILREAEFIDDKAWRSISKIIKANSTKNREISELEKKERAKKRG